jgi:hypothetical protein
MSSIFTAGNLIAEKENKVFSSNSIEFALSQRALLDFNVESGLIQLHINFFLSRLCFDLKKLIFSAYEKCKQQKRLIIYVLKMIFDQKLASFTSL